MPGSAAAFDVAPDPENVSLSLGPFDARIGRCDAIRARALTLRHRVFGGGRGSDGDSFDALCLHGVVTDRASGATCVAFRARVFRSARDLTQSYTGQSYDLRAFASQEGAVLELGRFCQSDAQAHPAALRAAWAALTALADAHRVTWLVGCSSFPGANPDRHAAALAALRAYHLGPEDLRPAKRSPHAVDLPGPEVAPGSVPPLLRSYLSMGGWVSDHAVCDRHLDTVHVFTGLRVADIPAKRKERLRALVQRAAPTRPLDVVCAAP